MNKISKKNKSNRIEQKIKNLLSSDNNIILVFLFGSYTSGKITSDSDLDIAFYFHKLPDIYTINTLREQLSAALASEVDIVVLNNASPVIKMQVLKNGILLINKDHKIYNTFFLNTVNEYDDLKQTRKEIENNILQGKIYA